MNFEIGELYVCPELVLFLYPTFNEAKRKVGWIRREFCENIVFCVLGKHSEKDEFGFNQIYVLIGETVGWINVAKWMGIKSLQMRKR